MTELEITAEHGADPYTRRVGVLVGAVGILLSVVTIASHRAHTAAVIHRTEANDQWSHYQAKIIRGNSTEVGLKVLQALAPDLEKSKGVVDELESSRIRYASEAKKIKEEAEGKVRETEHTEEQALRFDIGEGLLELGLVLCSLYFLARKSFFPIFGLISGVAGTLMGLWGFLL